MQVRTFSVLFLLAAGLAGCNSVSGGQQGLWNSQFGANATGVAGDEASTAIALLQSNEFGQSLDKSDQMAVAEAQKQALRSKGLGVSIAWQNEETGRHGRVRPGPVYQINDTTCREFTHEMILNGVPLSSRGTACREADGSWKTIG